VIAGAAEIDGKWLIRSASVRLAEALVRKSSSEFYDEALLLLESIDIEEWGEDLNHRTRHLNALGETLIELKRDTEAVPYLQEVVDYGYESGFLVESARAHVSLALIEADKGETAKSNELVSRAIAFFLAAGQDEKARTLSQRLLPPKPQGQNVLQSELNQTTDAAV
jgi:tetratricopeptide (TPR) repeat protein